MHEYTVEFRISSAELVPASITEALGLEPSLVRQVGERRSETKVWQKALWAYNGFPPTPEWSSLEDGLTFLLDRLEPLQKQIDNYKQSYELIFWCGHFQSSFDGGPTLSAELMSRLGAFGVDLHIDNYLTE